MESKNSEIVGENVETNEEMNKIKSFNLDSFYVKLKAMLVTMYKNNLSSLIEIIKNNKYGNLIVMLFTFLSVVFGYVTLQLLQNLYFFGCFVNSIRAIKNNQDFKPIIENWITYCSTMLIFYFFDSLSSFAGNIIRIIFDTLKFVILFCLYGSEQSRENINYWTSRIYSCNNRVIDTTQNTVNLFLNYIYDSCNKESFEKMIKSKNSNEKEN